MSDWEEIDSGVPQGSVLGPLFFVIFINDLLMKIKNEGKLFADDTKLLAIIKSELDNMGLQDDLNILKEWTNEWQIKFNSLKCKVMHFGKSNPKYKYKNDEVILEEVNVEKDLGIFISNDMNWNHHINYAINKANKQLGRIKNAFEFMNEYIICLLYKSLIRPHLEYGAVIWNTKWK
jgi:ribonuclease P/MRP protein subunit RPP40